MDMFENEFSPAETALSTLCPIPTRKDPPTGDMAKRRHPIQTFNQARLNQPGEVPYAGMTLFGACSRIPRVPQPGELDHGFLIEDLEQRAAWLLDNIVYAGCSRGKALVLSVKETFNGEIAQGLLMPLILKPSKPSRKRRRA